VEKDRGQEGLENSAQMRENGTCRDRSYFEEVLGGMDSEKPREDEKQHRHERRQWGRNENVELKKWDKKGNRRGKGERIKSSNERVVHLS